MKKKRVNELKTNMKTLDPYKTICVVKHDGKEVGRIPATAPTAEAYIMELVRHYGNCHVDYVPDETGGLFAMLHQRRNRVS